MKAFMRKSYPHDYTIRALATLARLAGTGIPCLADSILLPKTVSVRTEDQLWQRSISRRGEALKGGHRARTALGGRP